MVIVIKAVDSQHPPRDERRIGADVKLGSEKFEERSRNTFGEDVSNLKVRGHILCAKFASDNKFPNKMVIKFNMLGPFMGNRIRA